MDKAEIKILLESYIESYNPECFNRIVEIRGDNSTHNKMDRWGKHNREILSSKKGWTFGSRLTSLIDGLQSFMVTVVKLYGSVHKKKDIELIISNQRSFIRALGYVGDFSKSIRLKAVLGDQQIAEERAKFSLFLIDDCIKTIKDDLCIDIMNCPLKNEVVKNRNRLAGSALFTIPKNEIPNPYHNIFNSSKGYLIFKRLYENYKSSSSLRADFSFIFYAMQHDKFIICRNVDFIDFLSAEFDITIDKIDSRMSGYNKRTLLYESIKNQIF